MVECQTLINLHHFYNMDAMFLQIWINSNVLGAIIPHGFFYELVFAPTFNGISIKQINPTWIVKAFLKISFNDVSNHIIVASNIIV